MSLLSRRRRPFGKVAAFLLIEVGGGAPMQMTAQMPTPSALGPIIGDVRERVLAEHARLRTVIHDVDRLATAVAAGDFGKSERLRERAERLYRMLNEHIDHEERVLAPIVERIDAWGPLRLE